MPILDTDGGRIHYALFGAGPDIVLIHGLGANLAFWQLRLIAGLSARFRENKMTVMKEIINE